ncbi:MAG TPA: alpha/beta hydrolase [Kineosporiaceae bacterium]|jgi:non-heme chloroperoxidase|nr:alpha/beta hydrolase [Kineosporiaceae bacterium]
MPTIHLDDHEDISYRSVGEGVTTLLCMHGWAGSGAYFDPMIAYVDPSGQRTVTFDLPSHGGSADATGPFTLDRLADAVIAVADAAGADTFVLLGFSMSGKFAQYVTHRHPDRVLGQVLVAGCPVGELALPPDLLEDWYARAGDAERLAEIVLTYSTQPIPRHVLDVLGHDAARVPLPALRGTMELVTSTSFVEEVAGSVVPTLVVGGAHDLIFTPQALADGVVEPLAHAQLQLLDCGHEVPVELPRQLAGLVDAFVAELGSARWAARSTRTELR